MILTGVLTDKSSAVIMTDVESLSMVGAAPYVDAAIPDSLGEQCATTIIMR